MGKAHPRSEDLLGARSYTLTAVLSSRPQPSAKKIVCDMTQSHVFLACLHLESFQYVRGDGDFVVTISKLAHHFDRAKRARIVRCVMSVPEFRRCLVTCEFLGN